MRWLPRGHIVGLHNTPLTQEVPESYIPLHPTTWQTTNLMQVDPCTAEWLLLPKAKAHQLASLSPCALHGGSELHTPHHGIRSSTVPYASCYYSSHYCCISAS
jgi:hypothetical protein